MTDTSDTYGDHLRTLDPTELQLQFLDTKTQNLKTIQQSAALQREAWIKQIHDAYASGVPVNQIARVAGISRARVYQIINEKPENA